MSTHPAYTTVDLTTFQPRIQAVLLRNLGDLKRGQRVTVREAAEWFDQVQHTTVRMHLNALALLGYVRETRNRQDANTPPGRGGVAITYQLASHIVLIDTDCGVDAKAPYLKDEA
jgi:DNA-binding transcriptional ArsR family regulator